MTDLEKAIDIYNKGDYSLVLVKEDSVLTYTKPGIRLLVDLIESGDDFSDYSACDKIVGRAASFLYVLMGVKAVHGKVMAKLAPQILDRAEITYSSDEYVETILNKDKSDMCSVEKSVIRSGSAVVAFEDIKNVLK